MDQSALRRPVRQDDVPPDRRDPTIPNAGIVRYERVRGIHYNHYFAQVWYILEGQFRIEGKLYGKGAMIFHPDPHFESALETVETGAILYVVSARTRQGAIYEGRFNVEGGGRWRKRDHGGLAPDPRPRRRRQTMAAARRRDRRATRPMHTDAHSPPAIRRRARDNARSNRNIGMNTPQAAPNTVPASTIDRRPVQHDRHHHQWYDFFLYGIAAALIFNKIYFPAIDLTGTLAAFGTYAVGFVARPGRHRVRSFGDRVGLKSMLISLMLMGVPTVLIGLTPSYSPSATGARWPGLSLQGLAVGGEWGGRC